MYTTQGSACSRLASQSGEKQYSTLDTPDFIVKGEEAMKTVFVLLLLFLGLGLFARTYDTKIRLLVISLLVVMLVYITVA